MIPSDEAYEKIIDLQKRGELSQARTLLQHTLKANPKDEKAWMLYVKTLSKREERIKALNWCLKFNPDSAIAKATLAKLQRQPSAQEPHAPEQQTLDPDATNHKHTENQKSGNFIIAAILISVIVICIVMTSLSNLLDTPLFAFGPKYRASTYGITDPAEAVLVVENHSAYYIGSIVLTRHQDGRVCEFEGLTLEGVGIYTIEPGGYDLEVNFKSFEGKFVPAGVFYIASTVTAHFNVRKNRAVIFHLEGGGMNISALGFTFPELVGK